MTLGELRDMLADISDECNLETDVYIFKDDYNSTLIKNIFVDDDGDIIIE